MWFASFAEIQGGRWSSLSQGAAAGDREAAGSPGVDPSRREATARLSTAVQMGTVFVNASCANNISSELFPVKLKEYCCARY